MDLDAICVEIEGGKYAKLLSLDKPSQGKLYLTTIEHPQEKAIIRICIFHKDRIKPTKEVEIGQIPPETTGKTKIDLYGEWDGSEILILKIYLNGNIFETIRLNLRKIVSPPEEKSNNWILPVAIGVPALILIILLFAFSNVLFKQDTISSTDVEISQQEISEPKVTSTPEIQDTSIEESTVEDTAPTEVESTQEIESAEIETEQTPQEEEKVQLPPLKPQMEQVYFKPNDAALLDSAKNTLDSLVELLNQYPAATIKIIGHCNPIGSEISMIELSQERAENVYNYLTTKGWNPTNEPIIDWQGGDFPVTQDKKKQNLNRRVEISINQ
jgi:outer membrane protein OmpA-like peptidoglycan-associated protein